MAHRAYRALFLLIMRIYRVVLCVNRVRVLPRCACVGFVFFLMGLSFACIGQTSALNTLLQDVK